MQVYQTRDGLYDKSLLGDRLVGVALVSTTGREHGRIDRLYLAPFAQNLGIGSQALKLIERKYPRITEWSLDTIKRSPRNLHFYEKNGCARMGEDEEYVYYAKKIEAADRFEAARRPAESSACESNARFEDRSFARADFRRCDLTESDFMGGDLSRSAYSHLNMSQAPFNNCNLRELKIANANLRGSRIGDSSIDGSEILHVSLTDSSIRECDLSNVRLTNCEYAGMTIDGIAVTELLDLYRNRNRSEPT